MSDSPPESGKGHILKVEWEGRPKLSRVLKHYISWMNSVNKALADEWGLKLMHVYQPSSDPKTWQMWVFAPGEEPKLEKL